MEKRKNNKKGKSDNNKQARSLLFKNTKFSSIKSPRIKTTYNNSTKPNSLKILNKKNLNKMEEILYTLNNKKSLPILRKHQNFHPLSFPKSLNNLNSPKNQYKAKDKYSFNVPSFEPRDKEGIIAELYYITNDIDVQNKEIDDLTKDYNNLINNSLAYKIIIERILGLDENGNYLDEDMQTNYLKNREKSKSDNNFVSINSLDGNVENLKNGSIPKGSPNNSKKSKTLYFNKNNKSNYIMRNKYLNDKENPIRLGVLSWQKMELNRILIDKERQLIKIKNKEKNKKFDEFLHRLDEKNIELEELVEKTRNLQYEIYDTESQIVFYSSKIKKFIEEINSKTEKIKSNKNEIEYAQKDIENLKKCKEELKQKEIKLNEDKKQNENNFKEKQEKENKIDNLLKEKHIYFEEKQKIEAQIKDLQKQEDNAKQAINKKNLTIKGLEIENTDLEKQIKYYEERREKLMEKADQPRKNRIRMKEMENEIKNLEKNIITYKVENDEKEKNMEETEEKNNEEIENQEREINDHPNVIKDLEEQISNLKKDLKEVQNKNLQTGEELSKIEKSYINKKDEIKQEKEKNEQLKREKELQGNNEEEMMKKQNEEKYNNFMKNKEELGNEAVKLKEENNKIKEENENLKKLHKEKMELFKLANEKQGKLQKILNEIKELSEKS